MSRLIPFAAGVAATLAFGAIWHGPLGAGERLAARAEAIGRSTLTYYEMPLVTARIERDPLTRTLVLSGPADPFQRGELVRIMNDVPGVAAVRWDPASLPLESRAQ